jgi:hypothetical protein
MNRRVKITIAIVGTAAVAVLLSAPLFPRVTNCGGNSAALTACRGYATMIVVHAMDDPNGLFSTYRLTADDRTVIAAIRRDRGLRKAHFLVRTGDIRATKTARPPTIVIVADHPYDNVPERAFLHAPLSHAVGYSTGETGLISVEEFSHLDLTQFVDLKTLPK